MYRTIAPSNLDAEHKMHDANCNLLRDTSAFKHISHIWFIVILGDLICRISVQLQLPAPSGELRWCDHGG